MATSIRTAGRRLSLTALRCFPSKRPPQAAPHAAPPRLASALTAGTVTGSLSTNVCVSPAAFLHTGHVCRIQTTPSVTVTEEPDTLIQKLRVLVKGHDKAVLDSYEFFATMAAKELCLTLEKVFEPPKNIEKLTLLKSVHIFKKHRVQYEMRTHFRCIEISRVTGSTARVYLEYIQRNLPEGLALEVRQTAIQKVPEHIQVPLWSDQTQAEKTGTPDYI